MNRNLRRIALSLVAIVLGAGYLLKVIPPETDVGIDENYSVSIDGALITNPLDINEKSMLIPHIDLYSSTNPSSPLQENSPRNEGPTTEIQPEQRAVPKLPDLVKSPPDARSTEEGVFPPDSVPNAVPNLNELPTSTPLLVEFLASPVYPEATSKPPLGTPGEGSGTAKIQDDDGNSPDPLPTPDGTPDKTVNTDTDENRPDILPPPLSTETPPQLPLMEEFPSTALPPYFKADGPIAHDVPDFGGTLLLLTLSLGSAALARAVIGSKTNRFKG